MFEQEKDIICTDWLRRTGSESFSTSPIDTHLVTWKTKKKVQVFRLLPLTLFWSSLKKFET